MVQVARIGGRGGRGNLGNARKKSIFYMTSSLRPDDGEEDGDADDGDDNLYLAIEEKE